MQPYLFPYIGYFQLIGASEIFVFNDDAQYIKGGWINRNRIPRDEKVSWITLPVARGAHQLPINQRRYRLEPANLRRFLYRIEASYRHAPQFEVIFPLIRKIMSFEVDNVSLFNEHAVKRIACHLGISPEFRRSSELKKGRAARAQRRVIDICLEVGATRYINPIGGLHLYEAEEFGRHGIELYFLESIVTSYRQVAASPLSIIDVLMFNSEEAISTMLQGYRLILPGRGLVAPDVRH